MLEESIIGKALVAAKVAGLAINPVAAGLLIGATASVVMISKGATLVEKTRDGSWSWWDLVPISADAIPKKQRDISE